VELRQLRQFVALAEELHFGRAAERVGIAQPGLTQQIQRLEAELGVLLFDRSPRRVQLTAAGAVLLEEGRRALAQVERASARATRAGRGEVGRLVLGVAESATYTIVPELLRAYRAAYPDVDLAVRMMNTATQVAAVRAGEIDAGLARLPVDTQGLAARPIRDDRVAVLLPEGHRLAEAPAVDLRDLAGEPLVIYPATPRTSWVDFMLSVFREAGVEPGLGQEASDTLTAMALVAAGLGITLVPGRYGLFERPGLVWRPLTVPAPRTTLVLLHLRERPAQTVAGLLGVMDRLWPAGDAPGGENAGNA